MTMAEAKKAENTQLSKLQQATCAILAGGRVTNTKDAIEQASKALLLCDEFEANNGKFLEE